jgi:flagellar biosynthesis protein FliP
MNAHPMWLILASGIVALVPVLVGLMTSYVKVSIVLGMLKSALGTQQVPGNLVVMALSIAMSLFIMGPVFEESGRKAAAVDFESLLAEPNIGKVKELQVIAEPWHEFMLQHAGKRELQALSELGQLHEQAALQSEATVEPSADIPSAVVSTAIQVESENSKTSQVAAVSWRILLPAYVLTELKEAFAMGFVLLLPFVVIDLIVANILVGMGMFMVSPVLITLPLKLILFVVSDGWMLLTRGLIQSYSM